MRSLFEIQPDIPGLFATPGVPGVIQINVKATAYQNIGGGHIHLHISPGIRPWGTAAVLGIILQGLINVKFPSLSRVKSNIQSGQVRLVFRGSYALKRLN